MNKAELKKKYPNVQHDKAVKTEVLVNAAILYFLQELETDHGFEFFEEYFDVQDYYRDSGEDIDIELCKKNLKIEFKQRLRHGVQNEIEHYNGFRLKT